MNTLSFPKLNLFQQLRASIASSPAVRGILKAVAAGNGTSGEKFPVEIDAAEAHK